VSHEEVLATGERTARQLATVVEGVIGRLS
jgi:purine nucleoside phosphorylase